VIDVVARKRIQIVENLSEGSHDGTRIVRTCRPGYVCLNGDPGISTLLRKAEVAVSISLGQGPDGGTFRHLDIQGKIGRVKLELPGTGFSGIAVRIPRPTLTFMSLSLDPSPDVLSMVPAEDPGAVEDTAIAVSASPAGDPVEDAIIRRHVLWSLSAGLIPVPIADIAAVTAIQLDALKQLARHHGVECPEDSGKTFVAALSGGTFARVGASAVKAIPGLGSVLGGLTMSVISAASTYALCQVASHQFRTGRNLITENVDWARDAYRDALEQGKKFVRHLKDGGVDKHVEETCKTIAQLQSLRDKGILTSEEYEGKKAAALEKMDA